MLTAKTRIVDRMAKTNKWWCQVIDNEVERDGKVTGKWTDSENNSKNETSLVFAIGASSTPSSPLEKKDLDK